MGIGRPRAALVILTVASFAASAPAASAFSAQDLIAGLTQLDTKVAGKSRLTPDERTALHTEKAALIAAAYATEASGVTYADVLLGLDCVDLDLQLARNTPIKRQALSWAGKALACQRTLADALRDGGKASPALTSDIASVGSKIKELISRIRRGKAFGQKTTALRGFANQIASRDFGGASIYGVPFSEHFRDLECADVKVEAGRVSGASACLHRLRRFVKSAG